MGALPSTASARLGLGAGPKGRASNTQLRPSYVSRAETVQHVPVAARAQAERVWHVWAGASASECGRKVEVSGNQV